MSTKNPISAGAAPKCALKKSPANVDAANHGECGIPPHEMRPTPEDLQSASIDNLARILAISQVTAKRLVLSGRIKSYKIGSRRIVRLAEIVKFIAAREAEETRGTP